MRHNTVRKLSVIPIHQKQGEQRSVLGCPPTWDPRVQPQRAASVSLIPSNQIKYTNEDCIQLEIWGCPSRACIRLLVTLIRKDWTASRTHPEPHANSRLATNRPSVLNLPQLILYPYTRPTRYIDQDGEGKGTRSRPGRIEGRRPDLRATKCACGRRELVACIDTVD